MSDTPQPERPLVSVSPTVEQSPTSEIKESSEEITKAPVEQSAEPISDKAIPTTTVATSREAKESGVPERQKDRLTMEVEAVLEEDLAEMYQELSPTKQKEFAVKGEVSAKKIRQLLTETKINVRKIFNVIKEWLKMLPGVNKYFLEQEAKIKADKISLVAKKERQEDPNQIA